MISTSCMTGTGFMKCMPMTSSGRFVAPAIRVMGIDEVFDARITPGLQTSSSFLKMPSLRSSRSVAASTTMSASFMSSRLVLFLIRLRISVFWSALILSLATSRSRFLEIVSKPLLTNWSAMSFMMTLIPPGYAATWQMPLPI